MAQEIAVYMTVKEPAHRKLSQCTHPLGFFIIAHKDQYCRLCYSLLVSFNTYPVFSESVHSAVPFPIDIIFANLEAGYYTHDSQQDTHFLPIASLVCRSWSRPAQVLLLRRIASLTSGFCDSISSNRSCRKNLACHVQPGCLQLRSFAHAISLLPGLTILDLACYSRPSSSSYQHDSKPFVVLRDEKVSILRGGPAITVLRVENWSDDTSVLDKLLNLYHPSLCTLSPCAAPRGPRLARRPGPRWALSNSRASQCPRSSPHTEMTPSRRSRCQHSHRRMRRLSQRTLARAWSPRSRLATPIHVHRPRTMLMVPHQTEPELAARRNWSA